jgi:CBS domain-containing protein
MTLLSHLLQAKGAGVFAVPPGASVIEAIRSMADNHVGALMVMDGHELLGIVSERDYARKVILKGRSSAATAVREIMTAPVVTASPEQTVDDAMRLMTNGRFRHLPIVQAGRVVGVVSIGDLVKSVIEEQQHTIDNLRAYISG